MRIASISIDLDEVPRYTAIHGLEPVEEPAVHAVYDRCVPRLSAWLQSQSIAATFFAIGEDLVRQENRQAVAGLHRAGHEVANHSYHHHYDLTRRTRREIAEEIERGSKTIQAACGARPVGFRAPGYTVSDALFDALEASEFQYDSSVFPCASYYGLKAAALGVMRLRGRASASLLDAPGVLRAPRRPYRVGRPYWRRGTGLLELPIGVTPWQLPYIGTSLALGGPRIAAWLTKQMIGRELINLELHGFDAADAEQDGLHTLAPHRADLRRRAEDKLDAFTAAIRVMREAGYELVTLREAARRISDRPSP
ncbi:MAG: polysaccharide deacetylase family protein [Polyangiales bacterium]